MKSRFLLIGLVTFLLAIGGFCNANAREFVSIMTCGTAGSYYPVGGGIARIWQTFVADVNSTAESSGCSVVNLRLIAKGEAQAAICQNDAVYFAHKGLHFFKDKPETNSRGIAMLYSELLHVATNKKSGFKSISDLKGKRVRVGNPGSIAVTNNMAILNAYGLNETNFKAVKMSLADSFRAMKDGDIDALIEVTGAPGAGFIDLCSSRDIVFLPVDMEHTKKITKSYPYLSTDVIKKGTYNSIENDIPVLSLSCMLIIDEKVSTDLVYKMTKAIFDNIDILRETHSKGKMINLETALNGMPIPLHPGAEKFYREKNMIK